MILFFKEASVANLQQREKDQYEEGLKIYLDWYKGGACQKFG